MKVMNTAYLNLFEGSGFDLQRDQFCHNCGAEMKLQLNIDMKERKYIDTDLAEIDCKDGGAWNCLNLPLDTILNFHPLTLSTEWVSLCQNLLCYSIFPSLFSHLVLGLPSKHFHFLCS